MTFGMGSLLVILGVVFLVVWLHHNSAPVLSQGTGVPGSVISGTVFINGTVAVATTDEDFICATLDWWPPDKCDYGTCSWGRATLLTLVSTQNLKPTSLRIMISSMTKYYSPELDLDKSFMIWYNAVPCRI